ncbi:hypothetical protein CCACVL1_09474, partial [Corchorus capsularis]
MALTTIGFIDLLSIFDWKSCLSCKGHRKAESRKGQCNIE